MKRSAQSQIANGRSNRSNSLPRVLSKGSTTFLRLARDRPLRSKSYRIKFVQVFKVQKFKDRFGEGTSTFREFPKGRDLETGMKEPFGEILGEAREFWRTLARFENS